MSTAQERNAGEPPSDERRRRLLAIGLILGAFACFSSLDATAKWLSPRIGLIETTWARYVFSFLAVLIFINPWTVPDLAVTRRPWLQAVRSLMLFASTLLNFLALQYLQLAETVTIMFMQPLIVALAAGPLFGQWVGPRRLAAIGIGFLGVLLVTRPGAGGIHWAAIYSFAGMAMYATYALITQVLARHDSSETTMFYSSLAGVILLTPAMPFLWKPPPDPLTWLMMAVVGIFGAVGHWLLIRAHRIAPAAILAPFMYSQIFWMTALGFVVFGDVPDVWTLAGGAIVIASGLYLLHRERVRRAEIPN